MKILQKKSRHGDELCRNKSGDSQIIQPSNREEWRKTEAPVIYVRTKCVFI